MNIKNNSVKAKVLKKSVVAKEKPKAVASSKSGIERRAKAVSQKPTSVIVKPASVIVKSPANAVESPQEALPTKKVASVRVSPKIQTGEGWKRSRVKKG